MIFLIFLAMPGGRRRVDALSDGMIKNMQGNISAATALVLDGGKHAKYWCGSKDDGKKTGYKN